MSCEQDLRRGVTLLNSQCFFEAHEALEDAWRASPVSTKLAYQGLVQVAVAMHHLSRGNLGGGRSVLAKAVRNLQDCASDFAGLDIGALRQQLSRWQDALAMGENFPPWPQVHIAPRGQARGIDSDVL